MRILPGTSDSEGQGSAAGQQDQGSEADNRTTEVAENHRALLYRLQGATSRDSGRFVAGDTADRFWSQVERTSGTAGSGPGHVNRDGYGQFKVTDRPGYYRTVRAHRWAWRPRTVPCRRG